MKLALYRRLESLFGAIEAWAARARERVSLCEDCGGNRYTAPPCQPRVIVESNPERPGGWVRDRFGCTYPKCDCPISWGLQDPEVMLSVLKGNMPVPPTVCPRGE